MSRHLDEIRKLLSEGKEILGKPIQLHESGPRLNLDARNGDPKREFRHIHQMCNLHAEPFIISSQIKTLYLMEEYLWAADSLNPLALYSASRSILELHAVLALIQSRLAEQAQRPESEWRDRGIKYFEIILKARYGTTDKNLKILLKENGFTEDTVQLFKVSKAISHLSTEVPWIDDHYNALCDYVHHNLSSQRVAGGYVGSSTVASSAGGGVVVTGAMANVIQYQFPLKEAGLDAIKKTSERFLINLNGALDALSDTPTSPFTEDELIKITGNHLGMQALTPFVPKVGRNALCSCGSGEKYKKCHGK